MEDNKRKFEAIVSSIEEDLMCPICLGILTDPVSVPCCGNTYCRSCVVQSLKSSKSCPTCRQKVLVSCLRPVPRVLKNILEKFSQQNSSNNESVIVERKDDFIGFPVKTYPEYAIFGTFKTTLKAVEFTEVGIKLTNISPNNKLTKFKYHLMVPFIETQELLLCSDHSINLLFIKPTVESNIKIQDSMCLGNESTNGFKFDVKSEDSREHYIIVGVKERIGNNFIKALDEVSKYMNPNIMCVTIDVDFGKHLLNRAKRPEMRPAINLFRRITRSNANQTNPIN